LEGKVKQTLEKALSRVEDQAGRVTRLLDDATRICKRLDRFIEMKLVTTEIDREPLDLACYGLQLPLRVAAKPGAVGKFGRTNIKDRAEQAAEMLVGLVSDQVSETVIDKATQILIELPQRNPALDEAKLLADAVNLDDFGVTGLLLQCIQLCRTGSGVMQVLDGLEKREQYGYWDARLKEGFHFEPVRQIARERLENTRRVTALLLQEIKDDRAL